jgi:2,4-dienoyl-CoA reductase-like NADH-dependent reductase (Old Yellow Enzyme family)/NADPH-dependent 2,4-dienoyl-CoA reductase/sulfur reductase-like enzyme
MRPDAALSNGGDVLLQPLDTGRLTFKNRLVHVPTTLNMSDPAGHVTSKCTGAYESLAAGGFASVIVGATCVRRDGLINERMLGLYDDTYVIGQRDLVEVIHNNGSLGGIQLFYGGLIPGLGATTPLPPASGWIPDTVSWGPSAVYPIGNREPLVVPTEVYRSLVEDYAQAARRAREAGYDFISFHFCHGSLPHVTLSLLSNVERTDEYADHFLFCEQILERTQELCGKDFPIIPRLCCDENYEGGFDIEYFVENYAPRLHALGIEALDCTFGSMLPAKDRDAELKSSDVIGGGFYIPNLVTLKSIQTLRQGLIDKGIEMPLIGSCNMNTPDHMRTMLTEGGAALVGSCRQSLDDPDFPNKISEGREADIRRSTRTGASLLQGNIFGKGWAGSAQNASFGRDREYRIVPTARPKKVVIVGGGAGGMEYALTAAEIGHDVVLFEQSSRLGGVMDWAGNYRHLPNMEQVRYQTDWQQRMLARTDVDVRLGRRADVESILAENPDVVVIATGAEARRPDVPGLDHAFGSGFAITIDQALDRNGPPPPAVQVVIWGAGEGIELAVDLARDGASVRLIDSAPSLVPANYIGSRSRLLLGWLARAGLAVESGVTVEAVDPGSVRLRHPDGQQETVVCDRLVVSQGRRPCNGLAREFQGRGVKVQVIGDAKTPRSYGNAIHEAAYLVRRL